MSSQNQASSSSAPQAAPQTIAQRAAAGTITSIDGLTIEEEGELLLYALEQENLTYEGAKQKYGCSLTNDTLRGRAAKARARRAGRPPPARVPTFTALDDQLLQQAVNHLKKGPLDQEKSFVGIWKDVKPYIYAHGGTTDAGTTTVKKRWQKLTGQTAGGSNAKRRDDGEWHSSSYEPLSDEEERGPWKWYSDDYEPLSGEEQEEEEQEIEDQEQIENDEDENEDEDEEDE
ncbi:hypothetical protein Daus18300_011882 [Diaporthe australafricana]|uniref:Myb-like domain-containing protein n=1 Tax=Diaporthe australafricana TaxID=127596 RepID=A0ABR3W4V6_9PEZI